MPQRAPNSKPQPKSKYRVPASSDPPPAISTLISVHTPSPASSAPPFSLDVNSLDGLPLTRGAAACTESYKRRPLFLQMTARRNKCNGGQSGSVFALSPQQVRTVPLQVLPPLPNRLPSRTATLAPPDPMVLVPVCTSTRTWVLTSTSLWASRTQMCMWRV